MQKRLHQIISTVILAGMALVCSPMVRADEKIVQDIAIDNPEIRAQLKSMSVAEKIQMAKLGMDSNGDFVTTIFVHGQKVRSDSGIITTIVDPASGKMTKINIEARTFSLSPYNPSQANVSGVITKITPTNETKTILGYTAHHYLISISGAAIPGRHVSGDIWATASLPMPVIPSIASGPAGIIQSQLQKIKKLPLTMTLVMIGRDGAKTTIRSHVTSISVATVPGGTFAIPAGYTNVDTTK